MCQRLGPPFLILSLSESCATLPQCLSYLSFADPTLLPLSWPFSLQQRPEFFFHFFHPPILATIECMFILPFHQFTPPCHWHLRAFFFSFFSPHDQACVHPRFPFFFFLRLPVIFVDQGRKLPQFLSLFP